jgi:KaiC/GvpD/RAD55 family RecA-like ATPase
MGERVKSGVPGLDDLLDGGFPRGRVILVMGEPGSGKTILASQFLVNGATNSSEPGVFVSLDEAKSHLFSEMGAFGWDFPALQKSKKLGFVDATPLRLLPRKVPLGQVAIDREDFTMASLIQAITREVEAVGAQRVAIDSLTSMIFQYGDPVQRRIGTLELFGALSQTGATSLLTAELKVPGIKRRLEIEEFLAHGVVILQTVRVGNSLTRVIQVEKMRETACDTQMRPYRITSAGVEVFPKESVFK